MATWPNKATIVDFAVNQRGQDVNETTTRADAIDETAVRTALQARFETSVWSGTAPINGLSPDEVRAAHGISPSAIVGLVYDHDAEAFIVFQPHNPTGRFIAFVDNAEALAAVDALKDDMVESRVSRVLQEGILDPLPVTNPETTEIPNT